MDSLAQEAGRDVPERPAPADASLWLHAEEREGYALLAAGGSVQLAAADVLQDALVGALVPGQALIADLTGIEFLDSMGLRALILAHRGALEVGARLLLVPSPILACVIELGGLESILGICPDLTRALAEAAGVGPGSVRPPAH